MSPGRLARFRTPRAIATMLALVGIAGATAVCLSGQAVRRADRRDLAAWQAATAGPIERALSVHAIVPSLAARVGPGEPAAELTAARAALERSRREILDVRIPRIVRDAVELYLEGIARTLEAVSALQDVVNGARHDERLAAYERARAIADGKFNAARARHDLLRSRLRG